MLDPPGTMRTPSSTVNWRTGYVALSKYGCRERSIDISTIVPMRSPSRIPFLTHGVTRQPFLADASGCAARTSPRFSFCLNW